MLIIYLEGAKSIFVTHPDSFVFRIEAIYRFKVMRGSHLDDE